MSNEIVKVVLKNTKDETVAPFTTAEQVAYSLYNESGFWDPVYLNTVITDLYNQASDAGALASDAYCAACNAYCSARWAG